MGFFAPLVAGDDEGGRICHDVLDAYSKELSDYWESRKNAKDI